MRLQGVWTKWVPSAATPGQLSARLRTWPASASIAGPAGRADPGFISATLGTSTKTHLRHLDLHAEREVLRRRGPHRREDHRQCQAARDRVRGLAAPVTGSNTAGHHHQPCSESGQLGKTRSRRGGNTWARRSDHRRQTERMPQRHRRPVGGDARILTPAWHWASSHRRGLTHAADGLWTYSWELYELLVLRRGMLLRQHGRSAPMR